MQREIDFTTAAAPIVGSSDCETMKSLSALIDYLCKLLSWGLIASLLLLYGIFGKNCGYESCFVLFFGLSLVSHLCREAVEVWTQFPYWIDVERHRDSHLKITAAMLISGGLLGLSLGVHGRLATGVAAFLATLFFETVLSVSVRRHGEPLFRNLYDSKYRRSVASGAERMRTNERACAAVSVPDESYNLSSEDGLSTKTVVINPLFSGDEDFVKNEDEGLLVSSQTRKRLVDSEEISGEVLVEFDKSSDLAFVNLSFCPPFEETPFLDFEQTSGEEVRVNVSLLQTFGARLEIQRTRGTKTSLEKNGDAEPIRIEYYVSSKRPE